nr:histidine kinase [Glycomyces arizonensis]
MIEQRPPRAPNLPEMVGMAVGVGLLTALSLWGRQSPGPLDFAVAGLSLLAAFAQLWWPVTGALAATVLALLSPVATPAATVGALQVAWRRRFPVAAAVAVAGVAAHIVQWLWWWRPDTVIAFEWWLPLVCATYGALLGWGTLARSHRELVLSLRERARRAEAEQGRRVAEARAAERRGLAREMHDVLAHRLSLVATHAGALEYRPDASPEQVARAAGVVRDGVHLALEELRQVIGLLREDGEADDCGPQPTLADLDGLLDEAREAGQAVELHDGTPDAAPPSAIGRIAYRVLQEGLTNARKHAPGRPVEVSLRGAPGGELVIEIGNPLAEADATPAVPGSGLGLVGLTERVRLVGGQLDHAHCNHARLDRRFRLTARLPWRA